MVQKSPASTVGDLAQAIKNYSMQTMRFISSERDMAAL